MGEKQLLFAHPFSYGELKIHDALEKQQSYEYLYSCVHAKV